MTLPELCIRRPVMTTLVMIGLLVAGVIAYFKLPVSDLPNVDFPTISVTTQLPGASPETMASSVATPLEKQFSTIAGIDSMTSVNSLGTSRITIQFGLDRPIDDAALDIQAAISSALRRLPPDLPNPPSFRKVNPAESPILYLALVSPTLPLQELDRFAQTLISPRISTVNGVAQVTIYGSQKAAVRVQVNPLLLAARGIGIDEIHAAVAANNSNLPTGSLRGARQTFTVESSGQLETAADFSRLIIGIRDGAPLTLGDVADVKDGVENDEIASWYGDERAIVLAIQRQPGTNTVAVVDAIRKQLPSIENDLPAAAKLHVLMDRSQPIRESVEDVEFTLLLSIALVILVIFLFLRKLTATLIPSVAIPLSIIGTFAVMYLCGYSLDNLSLMALTLSVGFVVDDAIVVLENIVRHIEKGERPFQAALKGSREISFTVVSMTISLAAVFLPVLLMEGILGRLFREFAVTIGVAILVSGVVSLTLTPMLCSRFLGRNAGHDSSPGVVGRLLAPVEWALSAMHALYRRSLNVVLRFRGLMMLITAGTVLLTAWLFQHLPKGFIPADDIGMIRIITEGAQDASFDAMVEHQSAVSDVLLRHPHIDSFTSAVGAGGPNITSNGGRITALLKPRGERPSAWEIVADLRQKLADIPGIRAYPQVPPTIRIGGFSSKSPYQFTLFGIDLEALYRAAPEMEARMREMPILTDVTSDLEISSPQVFVRVNRDKASTLGVTVNQVEDALYSAYGARQVSSIYTPADTYNVVLELEPQYRDDPAVVPDLHIRASNGDLIPISAVASIERTVGPLTVSHFGQLPSVTLSFATQPGVSLGDAVEQIEAAAREVLPAGVNTVFQGEAEAFQKSLGSMALLLVMAVVVIYIVLGILYESFIHPLTILSGLPSAAVGALLTLQLFGKELNVYGFVGILMLIGIVKKNAIMMIDFAIDARRAGETNPERAIVEAALVRFRPIMMTTFAALMGALPIALGIGAGAESRQPLGLAVCGGLLLSQLLTLYITPVFYLYMEKLQSFLTRKPRHDPSPDQPEEAAVPVG